MEKYIFLSNPVPTVTDRTAEQKVIEFHIALSVYCTFQSTCNRAGIGADREN